MDGVKKLQKQREYEAALEEYLGLYHEAIRDRDYFASNLYVDEIVQTLLLRAGRSLAEEELRASLEKYSMRWDSPDPSGAPEDQMDHIRDDVETATRKRFPERFKVQEFAGKLDSIDFA